MLPRPAWLAVGVVVAAGTVSYMPAGGDATAVAAAVAITAVLGAAATGAHAVRRPRLASGLNVATLGAALVAARLAIGVAAGGGGPAASPTLPSGNGPWHAVVEAAHVSKGRQIATLELEGVSATCSALMPADPRLIAGDRIEWTGRIESLGDGDYDRYLAAQGMAASCEATAFTVHSHDSSPAGWLEGFRQQSGDAIQLVIPEPGGGLAAAILVGLRDRVDRTVASAFTAAGVSHIVAISGWNIAILSATVAALLRGFMSRRRRAVVTVAAIVAYTLFAGASASVIRAAVMALVAVGAVESGRGSRVSVGLAWALVGMLLFEPATVADVGFQLSAGATAGLILWATPITEWLGQRAPRLPEALRESLGVSLAAQVATLPIVLLVFGRLALISPAANLVAVPLVPPIMALGLVAMAAGWLEMLGLVPALCGLVALPASLLLTVLIGVVGFAAAVPGANQTLAAPWNVAGAAAAGGLLLAVARWSTLRGKASARSPAATSTAAMGREGRSARAGGGPGTKSRKPRYGMVVGVAAVSVMVAVSVVAASPDGRVHVIVLDVGQGDAILLEGDRGGRILVDGGPDGNALLTALDREVPAWDRRLDAVILTHPHDDHVAGLVAVLGRYAVGAAYESGWPSETPEYRAWKTTLTDHDLAAVRLRTGMELRLDDVALRVLWPDDGRTRPSFLDPAAADNRKANDSSIVLARRLRGPQVPADRRRGRRRRSDARLARIAGRGHAQGGPPRQRDRLVGSVADRLAARRVRRVRRGGQQLRPSERRNDGPAAKPLGQGCPNRPGGHGGRDTGSSGGFGRLVTGRLGARQPGRRGRNDDHSVCPVGTAGAPVRFPRCPYRAAERAWRCSSRSIHRRGTCAIRVPWPRPRPGWRCVPAGPDARSIAASPNPRLSCMTWTSCRRSAPRSTGSATPKARRSGLPGTATRSSAR